MKTRLLGATVLVILAVIFVPMLLPSREDAGTQEVSVEIPPPPSGAMQTRVLQVGPEGASAGADTTASISSAGRVATRDLTAQTASSQPADEAPPTSAAAVASAPVAAAPEPSTVATAPVSAPASRESKAPVAADAAPAAAEDAAPVAGGPGAAADTLYTVNLGIYSNGASAEKLVAQAKRHGFAATTTPESFQGKTVARVTVGPFQSRAEAEAARLKLKSFEHVASMTVETGVVNQSGDAPASAIAPGQPGSWAVQLGAFRGKGNADALRDRLRAEGFDGYVDSVRSSGRELWRVRAGPYTSRDRAESARGKIARELKIKGNIVTQH